MVLACCAHAAALGVAAADGTQGRLHWYVPVIDAGQLWTPLVATRQGNEPLFDPRNAGVGCAPVARHADPLPDFMGDAERAPRVTIRGVTPIAELAPHEPVARYEPLSHVQDCVATQTEDAATSEQFDAASFAPFAQVPFLATPPVPCDALAWHVAPCTDCQPHCRAHLSLDRTIVPATESATVVPREPILLRTLRPRPIAPRGTMFLWSMRPETDEPTSAFSPPRPSAGFVLSRPPGIYSLDWVGFAITAPTR